MDSNPPRKPIGKRLRFEVFKRDQFTCQYCHARGSDVVLVVDHVEPVASGGSTVTDNLVTACEPCNQGKSDKPLSRFLVRAERLEVHLEQAAVMAEAMEDLVREQRATWFGILGTDVEPPPNDSIVRLFTRFPPEVAAPAVRILAYQLKAKPKRIKKAAHNGYKAYGTWMTEIACLINGPGMPGLPDWQAKARRLGVGVLEGIA